MSLRRKIILLFSLLAIMPLLAFAAFSYWQAQGLLRGIVQGQLEQTAQTLAIELEVVGSGIQADLRNLQGALEWDDVAESVPSQALESARLDSLLDRAVYLQVGGAGELPNLLAGSVPLDRDRCQGGEFSRLVEIAVPLPSSDGGEIMEAGFWASDLLDHLAKGLRPRVVWVRRDNGALLFASGCDSLRGDGWAREAFGLTSLPEESETSGTFRFRSNRETKEGAYAQVEGFEWDVVAASPLSDVLGSLQQLTLLYWLVVLGLGITTALAFSILIRPFTRSLTELARAAEEIGLGELDPWLPLPQSGELGQLTQAFSRMLGRIRQMVVQVNQSSRLAVVGQLSAYLAHEIRNPLSSIKLNLQRLRRWTVKGQIPGFCLEPLEISIREVDRLNAAVNGVLELSKSEDSPQEVLSLHHLVGEAADLVASRFRRQGVGLSLDLDAEGDLIMGRPGQIKSVVLNLFVNALEAQEAGGRLDVRSVLCNMPDLGGPSVSLHFIDDGPGVPGSIRDRIFEPFFTTKSGGAGIGLAMAAQAVQDNGGNLSLSPSFSRHTGAEFVVSFPLASAEARPRISGSTAIPRETERADSPEVESGTEGGPGQPGEGAPTRLLTPTGLGKVLSQPGKETEDPN